MGTDQQKGTVSSRQETHAPIPEYSVLMSVYAKDEPAWFQEAIESMVHQTFAPQEILIIEDGPVSEELRAVSETCARLYPNLIRVISLPKNVGLALAMNYGVTQCRNEWIARMDADDISAPERCEKELLAALEHNADLVGCDSAEFMGSIDHPVSNRVFPQTHEELVAFSRRRVPFCHPAVMMKKSAVLRAGNYHDVFPHDDYDLFVRMLASGAIGYSINEILFYVRVNENFYNRRGGWRYARTLLEYNVQLLKSGWMSPVDFIVRSCGNLLFSLVPVGVRTWLYRRLLRK